MKKLLILTITMFSLLSCSSENDSPEEVDPIIGKWQLVSVIEDGTDITEECEKKNNITFLNDETYNIVDFFNDSDDECDSEEDDGEWINLGNSEYSIDGEPSIKIIFSQNNTKWSATTNDNIKNKDQVETWKRI